MTPKFNFVRQQGFREASAEACEYQYPELMFQPRVIGILVLVGVLFQPWWFFFALSVLLWWTVLLPGLNPFDALYNRVVAKPKGRLGLRPAPAPRRFAQGMAATFMLAIGLALLASWNTLTWTLEALLLVALGALILGRFCLGSYLFLLFTREAAFANRTLPWAHSDSEAGSGNGRLGTSRRLSPRHKRASPTAPGRTNAAH